MIPFLYTHMCYDLFTLGAIEIASILSLAFLPLPFPLTFILTDSPLSFEQTLPDLSLFPLLFSMSVICKV